MKDASLIYNNYLFSKEDFINAVLASPPREEIPTCEMEESPEFYYIDIDSFYEDKHVLEISYKNNFLILKMKLKNDPKKFLFERIFYFKNIDSNNVLLHDLKNKVRLIIPKSI